MILIDKNRIYIENFLFFLKNQLLKFNFTYGFPSNQNVFPEHYVDSLLRFTMGLIMNKRRGKRND